MPKMTEKEHLARHDKHDRQIAAIRDLVQQVFRLIIEGRKEMRELRAAQKRTDASLKALIDTMRGVGNGKGKVDLK